MRSFAVPLRVLPLFALLLVACSPTGGGADGGGDGGVSEEDAGPASDGIDSYSAGMTKTGDEVNVTLLAAEPAPPDVGNNTWTLRVTDTSDAPLDGATVLVAPFMPEHDHGTSPTDFAGTPTGTAGEYEVGPFDLFMPSLWEMTVSVTTDGGVSDEVVFRFDIEG